jgi:hypothetical protein
MYLLLFLAPFYACNREMEPCLFNHYNHALFNRGLAVTGKYFQLDQPLSCSGKEVGTLSLWSVGGIWFLQIFLPPDGQQNFYNIYVVTDGNDTVSARNYSRPYLLDKDIVDTA